MTCNCLFVYGTLHPERAPAEIASDVQRLTEIGPGTIAGHLEQTPDYPTVRTGPGITTRVPGIIFQLPDDPTLLARLDAYEQFYPDAPADSLFRRELIPVTRDTGGQVTCWAYIYNQTRKPG